MIKTSFKLESSPSTQLPPLDKSPSRNPSSNGSYKHPKNQTDNIISEYQFKFEQIKKENENMRMQKDQSEEMYKKMMETNSAIQNKLDNL